MSTQGIRGGGVGMVGKGPESAMGKLCLLCTGCLVAGFVGQSIVALLTLNLRDRRQERGEGGERVGGLGLTPLNGASVYMQRNTHTHT